MEILIQICTVVGAIVLVIAAIFLVLYVIWFFSDDRKNIDQEIFEGDNDDWDELTIDRLVN